MWKVSCQLLPLYTALNIHWTTSQVINYPGQVGVSTCIAVSFLTNRHYSDGVECTRVPWCRTFCANHRARQTTWNNLSQFFDVEERLVTFTPGGEKLTARKIIKAVKPDHQCERLRERAACVCTPTHPTPVSTKNLIVRKSISVLSVKQRPILEWSEMSTFALHCAWVKCIFNDGIQTFNPRTGKKK